MWKRRRGELSKFPDFSGLFRDWLLAFTGQGESEGKREENRKLTGCKIRSYFFDSQRHKATMPALPGAKRILQLCPVSEVLGNFRELRKRAREERELTLWVIKALVAQG